MIYGLPPFYSRDTSEMYNSILTKPLRLISSANISLNARHLIESVRRSFFFIFNKILWVKINLKLLQKEQTARIGYSEDDFHGN